MSVDCLASSSPKSTNKGDETCITSTFGSVLRRAESLGEGQRGEGWMDFWSVSGEKRKKEPLLLKLKSSWTDGIELRSQKS